MLKTSKINETAKVKNPIFKITRPWVGELDSDQNIAMVLRGSGCSIQGEFLYTHKRIGVWWNVKPKTVGIRVCLRKIR